MTTYEGWNVKIHRPTNLGERATMTKGVTTLTLTKGHDNAWRVSWVNTYGNTLGASMRLLPSIAADLDRESASGVVLHADGDLARLLDTLLP